jgi:hypothetical protein
MKVNKERFDALLDRMIQTPPMKRDDLRTKNLVSARILKRSR